MDFHSWMKINIVHNASLKDKKTAVPQHNRFFIIYDDVLEYAQPYLDDHVSSTT